MSERDTPNLIVRSFRSLKQGFDRAFRPRKPAIQNKLIPRQFHALVLVGLFIICLITMILYFDGRFMDWKHDQLLGPNYFVWSWHIRHFFFNVTSVGNSSWILAATALTGLIVSISPWRKFNRKLRLRLISFYADLNFVFFTLLLSGGWTSIFKWIFGRARPKLQEELGANHFDPFTLDYDFSSFPSGHSTTIGAFGMAIALLFPRLRWFALWLALLGATSRVVVDAHYPSDAIAGLAFGAVFVILSARWLAQRNVMFKFTGRALPVRSRPI